MAALAMSGKPTGSNLVHPETFGIFCKLKQRRREIM